MPIYPGRRTGTWRVVVWVRDPTTTKKGRQVEEIVEGTKRDARAHERKRHSELSAVTKVVARGNPTFSEFCVNVYEPHARAHLGANTWQRARRYVLAALVEHFGSTKLDSLVTSQVEQYKTARRAAGVMASSVNAELQVLRTILRWAEKGMGCAVAPVTVKMLTVNKRARVRTWSVEEVAKLYASIRTVAPHLLHVVWFMLNTGVRKGEAIAAEWSWIDESHRLLRIPVTEYWNPKDKEPREVPIDGLMAMLAEIPRTAEHIFLSSLGTAFAEFPQKTFAKCVRAAGLVGGPHKTRHTFASHFLQKQPDLRLLAQVLGHSTTAVTELYAHLLPGYLERARNVVSLAP